MFEKERMVFKMKEKGNISRKQFLTGGASVIFGALLGKLSDHVYAEEKQQNENNSGNAYSPEKEWDQLPLDVLSGAYLVSDPKSDQFGGTVEKEDCLLTQYFHVYPGLGLMLSDTNAAGEENGWVGYSEKFRPIAVLRSGSKTLGTDKRALVTVPAGVYYLRGSSGMQAGQPCAWVKSFAQYALNCGLSKPDLTDYTEITELSFNQNGRRDEDGRFGENTSAYPAMGDVFFTPIGTDIILTFNNANIAPYINCGENYMLTNRRKLFSRCCGFGFSWYHCKTTEICNWLGACYETVNGCARTLTLTELQAADPHLYIRFPSHVTQTQEAARIRTKGVKNNHERLFTVVHVTDTHGDIDSTHAAYEYADQIGADFVALTGDYVPCYAQHGYDMLHAIIRHAKTPTVFTIGNHDTYYHSDQMVYEKSIAPIKDVIQASERFPYYYRDFFSQGESVRAISLYSFYDNAKTRRNAYYTQEQLLWLCDAMATAPDGGHIFILRHFFHHKPILANEGASMFYDYDVSDSEVGIDLWLDMGEDPVTAVVDAYNKRTHIFAQFSGELEDRTEAVTVRYDFSKRPDSEFVAYFTGHIHADAVGYARHAETKQAVLCSLCTAGVKGTDDYHSYTTLNSARDFGTDSQIALNVFTFDFKKKTIYTARVGNGTFKDREKTWMEMPYT